jgi:molybdate transport system ATP-binding protein
MISVNITKTLADITVNASFDLKDGCAVISGPSGAGKTSIINMISGLMTPDSGHIEVNGRVLYDSAQKINLPPEKRRAGYVFQESRLFPHMTVKKNLLYGAGRDGALIPLFPSLEGCPKGGVVSLENIADLLGIAHLLDRYPKNLSGGEKQRVALGRALLSSPEFLLMDEPMASLDSVRREELINYINRIKYAYNLPVIYVTHSVEEIMRMSDYVGIIDNGYLCRFGAAIEVLNGREFTDTLPARDFGVVAEGTVFEADASTGTAVVDFYGKHIEVVYQGLNVGAKVRFRIPAMDVVLSQNPPHTSARNNFKGTITDIRLHDNMADILVDIGGFALWARVARLTADEMGLGIGTEIYAVIKSVVASSSMYVVEG